LHQTCVGEKKCQYFFIKSEKPIAQNKSGGKNPQKTNNRNFFVFLCLKKSKKNCGEKKIEISNIVLNFMHK